MSINYYTEEHLEALRHGGAVLSRILGDLVDMAKPGVSTAELDAYAEAEMRKEGGEPSFKGYKGGSSVPFPGTVVTSINEEVVHAPPVPGRIVKEGDILKLDIGFRYKDLCTDMAVSIPIGEVSPEVMRLLYTTQTSLYAGLDAIRPGRQIRDIGKAVQKVVDRKGYGVVRDLVGHGVGHGVHEDPQIPNYDNPDMPRVKIKKGMVLAIEPMVNMGSWEIELADDQWTIVTADGSLSAHFEVTVAVTNDGYEIITPQPVQMKEDGWQRVS